MRSLLLYISLLTCFCLTSLPAQIPSNVLVGDFIDQLMTKVAHKELTAHQKKFVVPVALALGNAKVNLIYYLEEPIGETPVEVLTTVVSLNDIVNQFAAYHHMDDIPRQISELSFYVNRKKDFPLIEDITPQKMLLVGGVVDLHLTGKFADASNANFNASIVIDNSVPLSSNTGSIPSYRSSTVKIMSLEKKVDELYFQIPTEYLKEHWSSLGMLYLQLELEMPLMPEDSLIPQKVTYTLPFQLLPRQPGSIYLSYKQSSTNNKVENRKTRTFVQHSTGKYITENYYVPNKEGEKVLEGSAKLVVEWSDGKKERDWSYYKHRTSKGICFTVETVYNPVGVSGKVNFHIEYQVEKRNVKTTQKYVSVDLDWNDYQSFNIGYNTNWKLQFTDYNGEVHFYSQPATTALMSVSKTGLNLVVTTPSVSIVAK